MNKILNIVVFLAIYFPDVNLGAVQYIFKRSFTEAVVHPSHINHIATFSNWGKEYSVSFKFVPSSFGDSWRNVLHLTTGKDCCDRGQRVPSIWFKSESGKNWILIASDVNGDGTHSYREVEPALKVGKPIRIKVSQHLAGRNHIYSININGKLVWAFVNTKLAEYANVKLYCGDPWYPVQEGTIYNLKVKSS